MRWLSGEKMAQKTVSRDDLIMKEADELIRKSNIHYKTDFGAWHQVTTLKELRGKLQESGVQFGIKVPSSELSGRQGIPLNDGTTMVTHGTNLKRIRPNDTKIEEEATKNVDALLAKTQEPTQAPKELPKQEPKENPLLYIAPKTDAGPTYRLATQDDIETLIMKKVIEIKGRGFGGSIKKLANEGVIKERLKDMITASDGKNGIAQTNNAINTVNKEFKDYPVEVSVKDQEALRKYFEVKD